MTTGTKTINKPYAGNWHCGPAYPGLYRHISWTGTDYPSVKPAKQYELVQYDRPGYYAYGPRGQKVWIPERPPKLKWRRKWSRPPKRLRLEEHPYDKTWSEHYDPETGYQEWTPSYTYVKGTLTSCFGGATGPSTDPWSANDTLALLGRLRAKVAGSQFNLGVFLAEAPEALRMIASAATKLDKALRYARRGNFLGAARALTAGTTGVRALDVNRKYKAPARNWLELQYGWLPVLQDMEEGARFLAHQLEYPQQLVVRASLRRAWDTSSIVTGSPSNAWFLKKERFSRRQIKAILREDPSVVQLSGLLDPLSVLWERLPYSFVVDWAIPIGTWLEARGLASALNGTFVVSHKYWWQGRDVQLSPGSYNRKRYTGFDRIYYKGGRFTRTVTTSLEVPKPEFKPLMEIPNWRRAANAVALLVTNKRTYFDE